MTKEEMKRAAEDWYEVYRAAVEEMEDAEAEADRCAWQGRAQNATRMGRRAFSLRRMVEGMEKAAVLLGFTSPDGPIDGREHGAYKLR